MVNGLRRHIGHPAMVAKEIFNALRSPDQITLFRHLLPNRVMKSFPLMYPDIFSRQRAFGASLIVVNGLCSLSTNRG
jgi:predicted amidohydrolase